MDEAIFWLGQARGVPGYLSLKKLLSKLPSGPVRRQINFALSQNKSPDASALLYQLAASDPDREHRGDARFWLVKSDPKRAENLHMKIVQNPTADEDIGQTVFAISQLPASSEILLDLARNKSMQLDIRQQALFWLAHSDKSEDLNALADLLSR